MRWILAALAALLFCGHAQAADPLLAPTTACRPGSATEMRCLHNYARKQSGLVPLAPSPVLYKSATAKRDRIIACNEFSHHPCGDNFVAPPGLSWFGENLAYGYSIRGGFLAWLGSPGHRENLLNPSYRLYGSSFSRSFPLLWVINFGR